MKFCYRDGTVLTLFEIERQNATEAGGILQNFESLVTCYSYEKSKIAHIECRIARNRCRDQLKNSVTD